MKIQFSFLSLKAQISIKNRPLLESVFKNDPKLEYIKEVFTKLITILFLLLCSISLTLTTIISNKENILQYFSIVFLITNIIFLIFEFLNQDEPSYGESNLRILIYRYRNIILKGGFEYSLAYSKYKNGEYYDSGKISSDLLYKVSDHEYQFYSLALKSFSFTKNELELKKIINYWLDKKDSMFIDYNLIGVSNCFIDDLENGIYYFKQAIKEGQDEITAIFNIGFAYNLLGKYEKALSIFEYLSKKEGNLTAEILAESSYSNLKLGNNEISKKNLNEALKINSNNAHVIKTQSLITWEFGDKQKARETFKKLKEINLGIYNLDRLSFLKKNNE